MRIPTYEPGEVFHVGTGTPSWRPYSSFDGLGVSVSEHPEDWIQIARLGGLPTWILSKKGGGSGLFADVYALDNETLTARAVIEGLLAPVQVWRVYQYDSEFDDWNYSEWQDEVSARREYDPEDKDMRLEPGTSFAPTPKLESIWNSNYSGPLGTILAPVIAWQVIIERETDLDGFWWHDELDPDNLSAPRGVIFYQRLATWEWELAE